MSDDAESRGQATSQENVEAFFDGVAAINRGDVEYWVRRSAHDVVIIAARSAVEGAFVGHEGVRKFFADNATNFEVFQVRLEQDAIEAMGLEE